MSGLAVATRGLVHVYRTEGQDVAALAGVDLAIRPGETVGLLGPSGSGKSTLLALLGGLMRPSAGRIAVGGRDLVDLSDGELDAYRAGEVGILLQGARRNLVPYLSSAENVAFAQAAARRRGRSCPGVGETLALVGADAFAARPPRALAPGEAQLVALAVALAAGPGLLLADEPSAALSHAARDDVLAAIDHVNRHQGATVVVVTHDEAVARRMRRTVTIRDGRVGGEGRDGEEFAIVAADGSLPLPLAALTELPPGSAVRVAPGGQPLAPRARGGRGRRGRSGRCSRQPYGGRGRRARRGWWGRRRDLDGGGAMSAVRLEARGLTVTYGTLRAVDGVSLAVPAGRLVAVTGESGAGKSSLLWALAGAVRPESGQVLVDGAPIGDHDAALAAGVALMPQSFGVATVLSAAENVELPLLDAGVPAGEATRRAEEALAAVGLDDVGGHLVDELSGGQRQRVALARMLAGQPGVLLADEPTSALDHRNRERTMALLRAAAEAGAAVLVATHDPEVAALADEEWHLDAGRAGVVRG